MDIKVFIKNSLLDWDGKITSVVYVGGCNFRCPFCHNADLVLAGQDFKAIEFKEVAEYIKNNRVFVDGVCVTGGEPCCYEKLPQFLKKFKSLDILVKLDTNGSYPERLKKIISAKLVDYIAMDIKSSLEETSYLEACGIKNSQILSNVKESIRIIMNSGIDYEFRITVVPSLHTKKEILEIAGSIKGARKLALQNFFNHKTIDPEFKNISPYAINDLEKMAEAVSGYVGTCVVRG